MHNFLHVQSDRALADYCRSVADTEYLALDTEFMRDRTYFPYLGLIQIAAGNALTVIDVLSIDDFTPLIALLTDPRIEKIMHDPGQDIEAFECHLSITPSPIYDTQLAAAFLGYKRQIGYKDLLAELLNVEIDKEHTRSDWLKRPLSDGQMQYALDDVYYLESLRETLDKDLRTDGKYEWFNEERRHKNYAAPPYSERISKRMSIKNPRAVPRLRQIAEWREAVARKKNIPRQWVLSNVCLLKLSEYTVVRDAFNDSECKRAKKYVTELTELWKTIPPDTITSPRPKLSLAEQNRLARVRSVISKISENHKLEPTLIANKQQLVHLIHSGQTPLFDGWRGELVNPLVGNALPQL